VHILKGEYIVHHAHICSPNHSLLIVLCIACSVLLNGCAPSVSTIERDREHFNTAAENYSTLDMVLDALFLSREDLGIGRSFPDDPFLLKKVPLFLKAPSQILPFANQCEVSLEQASHAMSSMIANLSNLMEIEIGSVNPEERRIVVEFKELPKSPLRQAVETIYQDLHYAQDIFNGAFEGLEDDEIMQAKQKIKELLLVSQEDQTLGRFENQMLIERAFSTASQINRTNILKAYQIVALSLDRALEMFTSGDLDLDERLFQGEKRYNTSGGTLAIDTPGGQILIGGEKDNYYRGKMPLLLIELGGNDLYKFEEYSAFSIIIDVTGDDLYQGKNFAFGSGFFGAGLLQDLSGDDRYISGMFSQGAGALGIGVLSDKEGDDFYESILYSQGFGYVGGGGFLLDQKGNDSIISSKKVPDYREESGAFQTLSQGFGMGSRNFAAGGLGILYNGEGNDIYEGSYFAQGASYWLAIGMLIDRHGQDHYIARRYSQGAGVHWSIGALVDQEGKDRYLSWGVSQGCGHDRSVGVLWDQAGEDTYNAEWLSQGAGSDTGIGLLIDDRGDDVYEAGTYITQGNGRFDKRRPLLR
jgi:hypothetical protein